MLLLALCGVGGLAGGVTALVFAHRGRKSRPTDVTKSFRLRLPKLTLWVGVLCTLFFAFCLWSCLKLPGETDLPWWVAPAFLLFFILGLYLILSYLNRRAWLYDDFCILGDCQGRKYRLLFTQVESVSPSLLRGAYRIHAQGRIFLLPMETLGVRLLLAEFAQAGAALPQSLRDSLPPPRRR